MDPLKKTLWTRNFTLVTFATILGSIGGIAGSFALSFLVFDETGSTLASALLLAIQVLPNVFIPIILAPVMDRLPRKPFLVGGDAVNGALYFLLGVYLLVLPFAYIEYLCFSLVLACLSSFDQLAYNSFYPRLIPGGFEEKGYTVSSMIYPVLNVVMMPVAALLLDAVGVPAILMGQGVLSLLAALTESRIRVEETVRRDEAGKLFSFKTWWRDLRDAARFLQKDDGLRSIYLYMMTTNGLGNGYSSILVAFFRSTPGFTVAMYSLFTVFEFAGRSLGGILHYRKPVPAKHRFTFAFWTYQIYEAMDMLLLWLPYPLMLLSRAACGFLGINSAVLREAAVQKYIPEEYRARLNAFFSVLISAGVSAFGLLIGAMGELLDYRLCITLAAGLCSAVLWCTVWRHRKSVRAIYNRETEG